MHTVPTCLLTVLLSCCLVAADEPVTLPHVWVSQGFTPAETDSLAIEQRSDGTFVVFATAKTGNRIDVLDIAADGLSAKRVVMPLPMPAGRFRSVVVGPDGDLFVSTESELYRLSPK